MQQRSSARDDWQHLIKLKKHSAWNTTLCGDSPSSSSSFTVFFFFPGSCFWPQHEQIWSPVPAGCGGEHGQANTHWIQPHLPHHHSRRWARHRHQPQTVPQPPKKTQGKTPASHKQVFAMSYFHIPLHSLSGLFYTLETSSVICDEIILLGKTVRNPSSRNCPLSELLTCFFSCDVITLIPPNSSENQTLHRDHHRDQGSFM